MGRCFYGRGPARLGAPGSRFGVGSASYSHAKLANPWLAIRIENIGDGLRFLPNAKALPSRFVGRDRGLLVWFELVAARVTRLGGRASTTSLTPKGDDGTGGPSRLGILVPQLRPGSSGRYQAFQRSICGWLAVFRSRNMV